MNWQKNQLSKYKAAQRYLAMGLFSIFGLFCLFGAAKAIAQTDQGAITGLIHDDTGAAIPNARVTLTSVDTGLVLSTSADGSGVYTFSPVKIGNYKVSATADGFQTTTQEKVQLQLGERLNIPISLKPGAVSQTVEVTDAPPLLQTQSAAVGQVLSTQTINTTALNGRNWVYIAQLTAGVDPAAGSRGAGQGDFEANGQDAGQNNFILDGVDNNINSVDFLNGASFSVRPPPDALAEFEVSTSNYNAEYGHSAGAVVNASLKSGTNDVHGALWEYFRNTVLDARDFDALSVPKYNQNQFGATLGAPILRNKLFFFGDVENNRIVFGQTFTGTVPTAAQRNGDFSELLNTAQTGLAQPVQLYQPNSGGTAKVPNNVYRPDQIDKVAQTILNLYPAPNTNGNLIYNNYNISTNSVDNRWSWDTRVDFNISPKDQTFARYSYLNERATYPSPLGPILDGGSYAVDGNIVDFAQQFVGSETHVFNPQTTNEFRFSYTYGHFEDAPIEANVDTASQVGLGGIPFAPGNGGLPPTTIGGVPGAAGSASISGATAVGGISSFGTPAYYTADEFENTYQILDNVTKIVGNHSLKFGVDFESIRFSTLAPPYSRGNYGFNGQYSSDPGVSFTGFGTADFLTNQINSASVSNLKTVSNNRWYRSAYAQDDWRLNSRLTLNLGVRYEYFQPYQENSGSQANFYATGPLGVGTGSGTLLIPSKQRSAPLSASFLAALSENNITLQYSDNPRLANGQKLNFSPRVGFAFQADRRTVLRGGYGIFFGGLENIGGSPNLGFQYPFQFTSSFPAPNCIAGNCPSNGLTLENGFNQAIAEGLQNFVSTPGLIGLRPQFTTPYTQSENLTLQRELNNNLTASIGYVGTVGRHLFNTLNQNAPAALINPGNNAQFVQPFPLFAGDNFVAVSAVSTYNALQAKIDKRFSNGLSFLTTYTWSHSLDDAPSALGSTGEGGYRNPTLVPIINDFANSPFDTRQRFTINGLYELPFGVGRAHFSHRGVAELVAGGWSSSLTFAAQTGNPFTVYPDITAAAGGSAHAIRVGDPFAGGGSPDASNPGVSCPTSVRNRKNWYNPCAFANPLPGSLISPGPNGGNPQPGYSYPQYVTSLPQVEQFLGGRRNQITGPGYERINMSVFKDFTTFREQKVQFRTDIFNLLNTPAYGDPSVTSNNSNGGQITAPRFLQSNTPDARFFQFSLKYLF
ncbi:MAG: carboxypeptidase regulatory-like domain-containing protein [Acidobacteriaceae bacterium]